MLTTHIPKAKPFRQALMVSTTRGCWSDTGLDRQSDRQPVKLLTVCSSSQAGTEPRALREEHTEACSLSEAVFMKHPKTNPMSH